MSGEKKPVSKVRSSRVKVARKKAVAPTASETQGPEVVPQVEEQVAAATVAKPAQAPAAEQIALALQSQAGIVEQEAEKERRAAIFFDSQWYLNAYPDIREAGVDPLEHFLDYGAKEGRNPNALFNSLSYLRVNPDVAGFGPGPFIHYICYGFQEGRPLR
ncbi:hypothetical protein [Acetobacter pasteurianus]|uniref:hypothetical protein n=1 Tax=Acetobacter pasteurianus TaxID=438 RepID=UPI003D0B5C3F